LNIHVPEHSYIMVTLCQ